MHFEILVEGQSELTALSIIMPKIVGAYDAPHTWRIHKHRGVGELPQNPLQTPDNKNFTLLHQLPAKLRSYSKTQNDDRAVIVLIDSDDKEIESFRAELLSLLDWCEAEFNVHFSFAIEELEAWYLGDRAALISFNPNIKTQPLDGYVQDSICGTWEVLAKADDPKLMNNSKRSPELLNKKKEWAKKIPPHMDINSNQSPSFNEFISYIKSQISYEE